MTSWERELGSLFHICRLTILEPAGSLDGERAGLQPLLTPLGRHISFENSDISMNYQQGWQEDKTGSVSPCTVT